ncbi:hypothetical protein K2X33_11105 [bacterium]|nr:hypothetical protein [bacterium]
MKQLVLSLALFVSCAAQAVDSLLVPAPLDNPIELLKWIEEKDSPAINHAFILQADRWEIGFRHKQNEQTYPTRSYDLIRRVNYLGILFRLLRSSDLVIADKARAQLRKLEIDGLPAAKYAQQKELLRSIVDEGTDVSAAGEASVEIHLTYLFLITEREGGKTSSDEVVRRAFSTSVSELQLVSPALHRAIANVHSILSIREPNRVATHRHRLFELLQGDDVATAQIAFNALSKQSSGAPLEPAEARKLVEACLTSPKNPLQILGLRFLKDHSELSASPEMAPMREYVELLTGEPAPEVSGLAASLYPSMPVHVAGPPAPPPTAEEAPPAESSEPAASAPATDALTPPAEVAPTESAAVEKPPAEDAAATLDEEAPAAPVNEESPADAAETDDDVRDAPEDLGLADLTAGVLDADAQAMIDVYKQQMELIQKITNQQVMRSPEGIQQLPGLLDELEKIFPGPEGEHFYARTLAEVLSRITRIDRSIQTNVRVSRKQIAKRLQKVRDDLVMRIIAPAYRNRTPVVWFKHVEMRPQTASFNLIVRTSRVVDSLDPSVTLSQMAFSFMNSAGSKGAYLMAKYYWEKKTLVVAEKQMLWNLLQFASTNYTGQWADKAKVILVKATRKFKIETEADPFQMLTSPKGRLSGVRRTVRDPNQSALSLAHSPLVAQLWNAHNVEARNYTQRIGELEELRKQITSSGGRTTFYVYSALCGMWAQLERTIEKKALQADDLGRGQELIKQIADTISKISAIENSYPLSNAIASGKEHGRMRKNLERIKAGTTEGGSRRVYKYSAALLKAAKQGLEWGKEKGGATSASAAAPASSPPAAPPAPPAPPVAAPPVTAAAPIAAAPSSSGPPTAEPPVVEPPPAPAPPLMAPPVAAPVTAAPVALPALPKIEGATAPVLTFVDRQVEISKRLRTGEALRRMSEKAPLSAADTIAVMAVLVPAYQEPAELQRLAGEIVINSMDSLKGAGFGTKLFMPFTRMVGQLQTEELQDPIARAAVEAISAFLEGGDLEALRATFQQTCVQVLLE